MEIDILQIHNWKIANISHMQLLKIRVPICPINTKHAR